MTDPNGTPYTLPPIDVVGQRRVSGGAFPQRGGGGGGGGGSGESGVHQDEVSPDEPPPPPTPDPCADSETAREWNADAAAAAGLRRMQDDANDPLLDGRERSIVIAHDPTTGVVYAGNMLVGELGAGTVGWDFTGINPAHIIGLMHSHPGSGPYPSGPDQTDVFPAAFSTVQNAGGDPHALRLYMVGTRADPGGPARLQIRVYNETNLNGDENTPGPEVNPDAQPCSS